MRVCVIGMRGFPMVEGGVEKHCESVYPLIAVCDDGSQEIYVFRRRPYVKTDTQVFPNIRFIDLPSTKIKGFEAALHSFLACLKTIFLRPDVAHIHNIGPGLFAPLLKLCGIPVVLTYHSPNYEHKKWGSFGRKLLKLCERMALKYADRIIFVNRFQMEKYPEAILRKSVYIPNGINIPQIPDQTDKLEKWELKPERYILSVGRITPEKGFHTLIEAFASKDFGDYKLAIAGGVEFENGYMKQLQNLAKDAPVVFTDYVFGQELSQLYANAGLFVLASENEGFPLVLLEAMGYQRNLLVSDIPGTHLVDLPQDDYFPCGDVATLAEKLSQKLAQPARKIYDLSEFTWQKVADQTMCVLKETAI